MRILTGVLSALVISAGVALSAGSAAAADDEGTISSVDTESLTITLDNGNTYRLPGEFNVESLTVGMEVVIAYDTIEGERTVTDLVTYE